MQRKKAAEGRRGRRRRRGKTEREWKNDASSFASLSLSFVLPISASSFHFLFFFVSRSTPLPPALPLSRALALPHFL